MNHVKQNIPEYNKKNTSANSGFKKLAVQWSIEHLCFVSSVVLEDSLVLRNRQLLKPAKRYEKLYAKVPHKTNCGSDNRQCQKNFDRKQYTAVESLLLKCTADNKIFSTRNNNKSLTT